MRRATLGSMSPGQLNSRRDNAPATKREKPGAPRQPVALANGTRSGRPSSLSRRSSQYGKNGTRTETRPIGDRAFQQECVRTIFNYLSTHGYKQPISQKMLAAPSSKDVNCMLLFLFRRIDPTWEFVKKIEEEVPTVFKRLGYPVPISRSALYAAGSLSSWPSLLAALAWLVDLLVVMEPPEEGDTESSPFEHPNKSLFPQYVNKCYYHYLRGEDAEVAALDQDYILKLDEENQRHRAVVEQLQAEAEDLEEQVRKLRADSRLTALQVKQADYKDDISKLQMVVSNFESLEQSLLKKIEEKKQELAMKKEEEANILKENESLVALIEGQQFSAADVEKLLKKKESLQVELQAVLDRKQELQKTAWDHEINTSKKLRDLENVTSQFNESFERLLADSGEELQEPSQFEIKLQPSKDRPEDVLGGSIKTVIKPALIKIQDKNKWAIAEEVNPEATILKEQLFKTEVATREKMSQISTAVALNKKLEAEYKAKEDNWQRRVMPLLAEREELEARIVQEELAVQSEQAEAEHEHREVEVRYKETVNQCNEEIEHERRTGTEILDVILSTKERTQSTLKRVHEAGAQSREVFRDLLSSG